MNSRRHLSAPRSSPAEDRTSDLIGGDPPFSSAIGGGGHFRPDIAVIAGAVAITCSLTCLLLLYAKHCKRSPPAAAVGSGSSGFGTGFGRNSGVEWAVVLSLPVFRFGSLVGDKEGLECAVCLARFEPAELLRLLPKCQHAFHVECVDTWLDAHSTCPLCRTRVDPEDALLVPDPPLPPPESKHAKPPRVSGRHSSAGERSTSRPAGPTGRRSADAAVTPARGRKDVALLPDSGDRRFGHRIVVAGEGAERWSDVRPPDLLFLRSEMIVPVGAERAPARCASEIGGAGRRRREEERWRGLEARRAWWARAGPAHNGPSG